MSAEYQLQVGLREGSQRVRWMDGGRFTERKAAEEEAARLARRYGRPIKITEEKPDDRSEASE